MHQLGGGGARRSGERVGRVPQIVKVEVLGEVRNGGSGAAPIAIDGSLAEDLRAFPGEDVPVGASCRVAAQVALQLGDEECRQRNRSHACISLGCAQEKLSAVELDLLLLDPHGAMQEIDVAALEAEQLAAAHAEEAGEQDQAPVSRRCGVGELPDLFDARDRSLGSPFDARPLDGAGIAHDQFVVDGGRKDRAQEPVALRNRVGRQLRRELCVPLADERGREPAEFNRAESHAGADGGADMEA